MSDASYIDRLIAGLPETTRDMLRNVQQVSTVAEFEHMVINVASRSAQRAPDALTVPHHFLNTAHVEQRALSDLAPRTLVRAKTILESGELTTQFGASCYATIGVHNDRSDILMSTVSDPHDLTKSALCFTVCWASGPQNWREVVKQYDHARRYFQRSGAPAGFCLPVKPGSGPKRTPWLASFLLPGVNSIASQEANDAMITMGVALMFALLLRKGL